MKNLPKSKVRAALALDWRFAFGKDGKSAFRCEVADADEPFGLENSNDLSQMFVAGGE